MSCFFIQIYCEFFLNKEFAMITTEKFMIKVNKIKRLDDLVALNHYIDYLLFRELDEKTQLGQTLITGLEAILDGKRIRFVRLRLF